MKGKVFELNPYDPCVGNKIIEGNHITVLWYVDDLKVSHVDPEDNTNFMECLEGIYRELRTTRGKVQKYFGMTPDFGTPGELWVTIVDYLKGVLEDFSEVGTGISMIPEANNLFQVRPEDEQTLLNKDQATVFHHTVVHLLYSMSRSRKDINMDMASLCARVRIQDEDDWGNIVSVLRCIRGVRLNSGDN